METLFSKNPTESLFELPVLKTDKYLAETIEVPFDPLPQFGITCSCIIFPRANTVRRITVRTKLPALWSSTGTGYVYTVPSAQVDGNVYVNTNTLSLNVNSLVTYFTPGTLSTWGVPQVAGLTVAYNPSLNKFVFSSGTYSNVFFKTEQSASFWGFDVRTPDFLTSGGFPGYNFVNGNLTSQLTLIQSGWVPGTTPPGSGLTYTDSVGTKIIKEARLLIGGQTIDRLTPERLYIEQDIKIPLEQQVALSVLEGKNDTSNILVSREYYTKLTFDIPTINLGDFERQELRIEVDFEKFQNLTSASVTPTLESSLLVKYENYRDHTNPVQSLYGQTDLNTFTIPVSAQSGTFPLEFAGPVRELWLTVDQPNKISRVTFKNNGDTLFDDDQSVLQVLRPYKFYTNMPTQSNLYVYNFSLDPEKLKPSGSLNFSRLFYPTLEVNLTQQASSNVGIRVYSRNFNVIRTEAGLAGLEFNSSL